MSLVVVTSMPTNNSRWQHLVNYFSQFTNLITVIPCRGRALGPVPCGARVLATTKTGKVSRCCPWYQIPKMQNERQVIKMRNRAGFENLRNLKTYLFVKFVNESTLAIWFWGIIVKHPRMLSAQFVALYKPCKPKPKKKWPKICCYSSK